MAEIKIQLPDSFYKEEERQGYVISSGMKKVWAVELDILVEFDRICKILNINYFLDSGTLLGAVRHQGFIPWDDDIDVIMLREDYDVLITEGKKYFRYPYFFQCAYTDVNYFRGHAQIRNSSTTGILPEEGRRVPFDQGIFMDVFVLDGLTSDYESLKKQITEQNAFKDIYNRIYLTYSDNPVKKMLKKLRLLLFKLKYGECKDLYKKFETVSKRFEESEYVDKVAFRTDPDKVYYLEREWFSDTCDVIFEEYHFRMPVEYDKILSAYYGSDYMIPRNAPSLHGHVIFDTEKTYKEILAKLS